MKTIVKGLIGAEDLNRGFGTFQRTTSSGGTQTMTQVQIPSRSVFYVGDDFATYWGTSDIGAQINAAYAAMPIAGGTIEITPPQNGSAYSFSTSILFGVAHKYVRLRGLAPGNTVSGLISGGITLNFTPTAGSNSLTLTGVAAAISGTAVYSGTITGGGSNALVGKVFQVKSFASALNNGYFTCTASSTSSLTLSNGRAVLDSIGGTCNQLTTAITFANDGGAEGDGYNPAQFIEGINLINNEAITPSNGGLSNGTVGLDFSGAGRLTMRNVLITGFGVGAQAINPGGWNAAWYQVSLSQNNVGLQIYNGFEMFNWFGGALAVNDVGVSFSGKNIPAANTTFHGVSIDSNVTFGIKETSGSLQTLTFVGCHFENLAGGGATTTTHYVYTESASVIIQGGTAIDDATSGTAVDYWFSVGWTDANGAQGNYFFLGVYGLLVQPSGRTATLIFRIGSRAFLSGLNTNPNAVTNLSNASVRGAGVVTDLFQNNNGFSEHPMEISGKLTVDGGLLGGSPNKQIFTTSGTFTVPAGVPAVKVTVVAGGGGGGGATSSNIGAGGGAGSVGIKWLTGLVAGNTLAVTVGAGGAGNSGSAGSNGVASSVASGTQSITTIATNPGFGGNSGSSPQAGQLGGAAGTGGDLNMGGGGSSDVITNVPSAGGASIFGGGGSSGGNAGSAYGSGGGGGRNGSTVSGGVGQQGIVIFEWIS